MTHTQDAFAYQAEACRGLGSPFMGRLCDLLATRDWPEGAIADRVFAWAGDISARGESVPLRLAGALHALVLTGDPALAQVYPPHDVDDETLWQAVSTALIQQADTIDRWLDSAPQTNEVRRSAVLIAVGHLLAERFGLPLICSELGASGGLNLNWDRYALDIKGTTFGPKDILTLAPEWTGPVPPATRPMVTSRAGVDLNPLDPQSAEDALRLQAYLWPDQPERMTRTRAAIRAADTKVTKADAIEWLQKRLEPKLGNLHLIYHTVAWQYFPASAQERGTAMIAAAGTRATNDAPIAWFGMENDGSAKGAALTLRLWPGDLMINLGRADFHGRWVNWKGA